MSQLVYRVGRVPRKTASPDQSPALPAPFLLQEASPDWTLHSGRAHVTGKNGSGLRLVGTSFGHGRDLAVARVSSRKEAFDATQNLVVVLTVVSISDPTETCVEFDWRQRAVDV